MVAENGAQSIRDLYANGYKLGIISNLVTSKEIPDWLEHDDLAKYFGAVLLSCVEGIRKPDPRLSRMACERLGVEPSRCVYIGDNLKRDIEGTKIAGFGMFILYTTPEKLKKEKITDENRPTRSSSTLRNSKSCSAVSNRGGRPHPRGLTHGKKHSRHLSRPSATFPHCRGQSTL